MSERQRVEDAIREVRENPARIERAAINYAEARLMTLRVPVEYLPLVALELERAYIAGSIMGIDVSYASVAMLAACEPPHGHD